jgi:ABC-type transport system involved in multi-copper enzyme maturation permease subunit
MLGAGDTQAITFGPALGVAFGLLAGLSAANVMTLRSLAVSGPNAWFLRSAPIGRGGVIMGKFVGAYLAFEALAIPTTLVAGIALQNSIPVLAANLVADAAAGAVLVAVGMFFGGLLRRASAAESTAVPRPSLAAGLATLATQSVLMIAVVIVVSVGQTAWLVVVAALVTAGILAVARVFVEGPR